MKKILFATLTALLMLTGCGGGQKYLMMVFTDNSVGDFGGGFNFQFTKTK